ncbi:MAG: transglycosylase SLT domain-containing protein [Desulfuromonadales bacterium]|nr:transglycosylase SLT domain-containing protein [Desulfuromonadales bacterium]
MRKRIEKMWSSHGLIEDIMIIPQAALLQAWGKIWKLRVMVVILVTLCAVLATANLKGRDVFSLLLLLEAENQEKDANIEKLQNENKVLEEKLSFKLKVDDLVAKIQKVAPWLDQSIIRPAAENALSHTTDPALYLAIGLVEAELQAHVVHTDGVALGMHGICPKDWHTFLQAKGIMASHDDYFDPVKSFKGSEAVLTALVQEYGSLEKALLYYNGGGLAAAGMIPKSTAYARRVMHLMKVFAA